MPSLGQRLPLSGGTIQYIANGVSSVVLDRSLYMREIRLRLAAAPTVTLANNTAAKTEPGDEWAVVKRIRLKVGNTVLREVTGSELRWINAYLYASTPRVTATLGDGATANPYCWSDLMLPIYPPHMKDPYIFSLDAPAFDSQLTLEVAWGDYTSINADATAWTTAPTLTMDAELNTGPLVPYVSSQLMLIESVTVSDLLTGFRLPTDSALRGIWMRVKDSGGDDDSAVTIAAANVATRLQVETANISVVDVEFAKLQAETLQLPKQTFTPRSSSESESARFWIDFIHDRPALASEALPTAVTFADGQQRSLDQLFLKVEGTSPFANSTDLVDLYLWRFANPRRSN